MAQSLQEMHTSLCNNFRTRISAKEFLIDSYENQSLMHQVIKDARAMNVPSNDIRNVLQNRLKNRKQTNELINGFF